jgi:transposase
LQLVCAARVKATEALKSAKVLLHKKKTATCPTSKRCPISYEARSYPVWFDRNQVSILAIGGRIKLSFKLAEYYCQYLTWKNTSTDLVRDSRRRWWLHIVMEADTPNVVSTNEIVGIDLGIVSPATDCRGTFYGDKD